MCGVFGIYGHEEAANLTYLGLHALQHRGQESAGIVTSSESRLHRQVHMGLVSDSFDESSLEKLPGTASIGQVRYSTSGESELRNAQPFCFEYAHGALSIAHNGNLVNAAKVRKRLEEAGSIFQTSSDTEVIVHLMAQAREPESIERLASALRQVTGAYSILILTETRLIAVRDPHGFRPLSMGKLKDATVFSSETCAFGLIEAELERELEPGEIVICEGKAVRSFRPFEATRGRLPTRSCVFEQVYFARPDSTQDSRSIYSSRVEMGRTLARESAVDADVVIAVPDSGVPAAIGYAEESGLPFANGLIRSHYVGRTFIEPQDSIRHFGVRLKLSPVRSVVEGKRVLVVDDSLVRGTTSRKIVAMLKASGAKEVHLRISAPPTTHSCFYGLDTPTRDELIASSNTVEEIGTYVGCTSLAYLSHEGLLSSLDVGANEDSGFCSACFTGEYPVAIEDAKTAKLVSIAKSKAATADTAS
ncbi:MAG: amidophosphoribosyltransferase [Myxococcales bacterium]|nr:amidophosphoribosyltransferase [Myxococcales bacterium]